MPGAATGLFLVLTGCRPPAVAPPVPGDSGMESKDTAESADSAAPDDTAESIPDNDPTYPFIGVIIIDTGGESIPDDDKIEVHMEVVRDHDGTLGDLDDAPRSWNGPVGIELHGSSSLSYDKLSYRIETRDDEGKDFEHPLLGMVEESDWVLHGPYSDKTLLRNALAYALGRDIAESNGLWQPDTRFAELILDDVYQGVYTVTERIKRDNNRVALPRVAATAGEGDLSGGYIVKIDQHRNDGFDTALGTPVDYHYPRASEITDAQDAWLQSWFNELEGMLVSDGFADPDTGYPAWLHVESWIDHFIINELAHNIDAYRLSAYLYKEPDDEGGRFYAGPLWDFDRAFGNVDYCYCYEVEGYIIDSLTECGYGYQFPFWWERLLEDESFRNQLRCRWEELRAGPLSDASIESRVEGMVDRIGDAEVRDHFWWGNIGEYVSPNYYVGETYEDDLAYFLDWTLERVAWLDAELYGTCER